MTNLRSINISFLKLCHYLFIVGMALITSVQATPTTPKTYFLNVSTLKIKEILPPPPHNDSQGEHQDLFYLKNALATRTKKQISRAQQASIDNVFDYAPAIGSDFNKTNLPLTADLFKKVNSDTKIAIDEAKDIFHRARPHTWKAAVGEIVHAGYSYPSGHTTRAFLWSTLLTDLFPEQHRAIKQEARKKAWNRVLLGRHYPNDIYGGEIYGKYLAQQFLKNNKFQHEWQAVREEVKKVNHS